MGKDPGYIYSISMIFSNQNGMIQIHPSRRSSLTLINSSHYDLHDPLIKQEGRGGFPGLDAWDSSMLPAQARYDHMHISQAKASLIKDLPSIRFTQTNADNFHLQGLANCTSLQHPRIFLGILFHCRHQYLYLYIYVYVYVWLNPFSCIFFRVVLQSFLHPS